MLRGKYFDRLKELQRKHPAPSAEKPFDFALIGSDGLGARLTRFVLDRHRFFLGVLRTLKPILRIGGLAVVTRYDDVKEVLDRHDVFEVPFGPEMRDLAGGPDFVLGMQDGEDYQRLMCHLRRVFLPGDIEARVARPVGALAGKLMEAGGGEIDAVEDLVIRTGVAVCRDYYGLDIDDDLAFAQWTMAASALLFADPFGSEPTRIAALAGAARINRVLDRAIAAAHAGARSPDTVTGRLVGLQRAGAELSDEAIRGLLFGMVTGFVPTNTLAGGNLLSVLLANPKVLEAARAAALRDEDARLERILFEALRFRAPLNPGVLRYVVKDVTIAAGTSRETTIKAGTTVMVATQSALFDGRRRVDGRPIGNLGGFDPDRRHGGEMVFGHGLHWCIGALIARAHLTQGLKPLLRAEGLFKAGALRRVGPFPVSQPMRYRAVAAQRGQSLVTIYIPIPDGMPGALDRSGRQSRVAAARAAIERHGNPATGALKLRLDGAGTIHFLSCNALDLARGDDLDPAFIILEMSADGSEAEAIGALVRAIAPELVEILTAAGLEPGPDLERFLASHTRDVRPTLLGTNGVVFSGTPGLSLWRIRREEEIETIARREIAAFARQGTSGATASAVLAHVRNALGRQGYGWCFKADEVAFADRRGGSFWSFITRFLSSFSSRVVRTGAYAVLALAAAIFWFWLKPAELALESRWEVAGVVARLVLALVLGLLGVAASIVITGGGLLFAINRDEKRTEPRDLDPDPATVAAMLARENRSAQNHMTAVSVMKPGIVRRLALTLTFALIEGAARLWFRPGYLASLGTIHFARWVRLPGTNKLLFFSNYGGSWESYLEDFITKARQGLTAVWSNTREFPRARHLIQSGAEDGDRFKRWARRQQIPTQLWYSAYPDLTTDRIRTNALVRDGIAEARSESEALAWLELFGSLPRPHGALEAGEIQSLVFSGFRRLCESRCLLLALPRDPAQCRGWLARLLGLGVVTFGDIQPGRTAVAIGLGADLLARLGVAGGPGLPHGEAPKADEGPVPAFPAAFRMGMAARSAILGDRGPSRPDCWAWGGLGREPDVALLLYAEDTATLSELEARLAPLLVLCSARLADVRTRIGRVPPGERPPPVHEPFGFVDGISQPAIRGTLRAGRVSAQDVLAPGEFVLGYKDERGYYPPTPQVRAIDDPGAILSSPPLGDPERWPEFKADREAALSARDLGRNGTYLVIRQLRQDVERFERQTEGEARQLGIPTERLQAKLVGRWKNGSSLVHNPDAPGRWPDNGFLYGIDDPQGQRCPLGAHVRRANPRDSLAPDDPEQIPITNRHRLLRVGRPYFVRRSDGDGAGTGRAAGILFMCLNADIERQFEFVQQTWLNNPSFHALKGEVDPLATARGSCPAAESGAFTIPGPGGALNARGLASFVDVVGGSYFFLPGSRTLKFLAASPSRAAPASAIRTER
jgi:Dyp-type peroxidase family